MVELVPKPVQPTSSRLTSAFQTPGRRPRGGGTNQVVRLDLSWCMEGHGLMAPLGLLGPWSVVLFNPHANESTAVNVVSTAGLTWAGVSNYMRSMEAATSACVQRGTGVVLSPVAGTHLMDTKRPVYFHGGKYSRLMGLPDLLGLLWVQSERFCLINFNF